MSANCWLIGKIAESVLVCTNDGFVLFSIFLEVKLASFSIVVVVFEDGVSRKTIKKGDDFG